MNGDVFVVDIEPTSPNAGVKCSACNGNGRCWICSGTGDHGGQQCGTCWGSGRCSRCGGTGIYMTRAGRGADG